MWGQGKAVQGDPCTVSAAWGLTKQGQGDNCRHPPYIFLVSFLPEASLDPRNHDDALPLVPLQRVMGSGLRGGTIIPSHVVADTFP